MGEHVYPGVYLYKRIVQAKLYIDNNFAERIDLDNIADEACFSKFHFLRLFKKLYGKTPHQYLICRRIAHAQQLLTKGVTVSDVCYRVGFESLGSFSVLFKRYCGVSPAAWQAEQGRIRAAIRERPLAFVPGCFASAKGWRA